MFLFIYGQQGKVMWCIVLCLLKKGRQSLLQKKIEKKERKKKKKAKLSKERKKLRVTEFTLFMLKLHSHWLQLVVIPCLTLCLVAPHNSKSCASTKF